jgi:hypothetical protein
MIQEVNAGRPVDAPDNYSLMQRLTWNECQGLLMASHEERFHHLRTTLTGTSYIEVT